MIHSMCHQEHAGDYDARHCLALVAAAGVTEAESFLHERLGDAAAALALHVRDVER